MLSLNNLDISFLCKELDEQLRGAFFNKFYDLQQDLFRLKLHKKGELNFLISLPLYVSLSTAFPESKQTPCNFTMFLRKRLYNAKLNAVRQLNFDRIVELEFEAIGKKIFLIAELFARGNLIVLDENRKIIMALKREEFASRKVMNNELYVLPPSQKLLPKNFSFLLVGGEKGRIVPVLSKHVNLSPQVLEQACFACNVSLERDVSSLSQAEKEKIQTFINKIDSFKHPVVYFKDNDIIFSSILLDKLKDFDKKEFQKVSEAVEFGTRMSFERDAPRQLPSKSFVGQQMQKKENVALKKLEFLLVQQEMALLDLEEKMREKDKYGKLVFARRNEIQHVLNQIKDLKKQGVSEDEIRRIIKLPMDKESVEVEV